jgi:hypothetical protein
MQIYTSVVLGLLAMFAAGRGEWTILFFTSNGQLKYSTIASCKILDSISRKSLSRIRINIYLVFSREHYHIAGPMYYSESVFGTLSNLSAHYSGLCTDHESNLTHVRSLLDHSKACREKQLVSTLTSIDFIIACIHDTRIAILIFS